MKRYGKFEITFVLALFLFLCITGINYFKADSPTVHDESVSSEKNKSNNTENDNGNEEKGTTYQVKVHSVIDGDTLKIYWNDTIETARLLLVDTPETVHPNIEPQPYGIDASQFTKFALKEGSTIEIELGENQRDTHNRLLVYVWYEGELFNEMLVEKGYARVGYIFDNNQKYLERLQAAQERAKSSKRLIWSKKGYVNEEGEGFNF